MSNDPAMKKTRLLDFMIAFDEAKHRGESWDLAEWQSRFPEIKDEIGQELAGLERTWKLNREESGKAKNSTGVDQDSAPQIEDEEWEIGPFRILGELGHGGQGQVYLAEDTRTRAHVALKVLSALGGAHEDALIRFRREADIASKINHKGICAIHEIGEFRGRRFIAMQLVDGKSLSQIIRETKPPGDLGKIFQIIQIVEDVARALHSAHNAHVIHRDVKPSNIMVDTNGDPVIVDFGLARDVEDEAPSLTATGSFCGTLPYMSPERLSGKRRPADRQVDVYALGVTMYELLCHELPFQAPTPEALQRAICASGAQPIGERNSAIPKALSIVVATAMERDLKRRYATALDVADDLRRILDQEPIVAQPIGPHVRIARWVQRNAWAAAMIVALMVLLSVSFFFLKREEKFTKSLLQLSDPP